MVLGFCQANLAKEFFREFSRRLVAQGTVSTLLVVIFSPGVETLSADALQALVRHKDYTTTQRYTNMAHQLTRSVEGLRVPDVLKPAVVG